MPTIMEIFIIGTSHNRYQARPTNGPQDGANAFKIHVGKILETHTPQLIAEEMSLEALKGRQTVCTELAKEKGLPHLFCDPNSQEREALGISKDDTESDVKKREEEWLRRLLENRHFPVLFVCGANHVSSFECLCKNNELKPTILTHDFEAEIPLERRIIS